MVTNKQTTSSKLEYRLLLVEDDDKSAKQYAQFVQESSLFEQPVSLVRTASLREAGAKLESLDIDVVLLDLGLPDARHELDPIDCIRAINPAIPIIALSKKQFDPLGMAAILRGATTFLSKRSLNQLILQETIQRLLQQSEQQNMQQLIEYSGDGILALNTRREVLFANLAAGDLLGFNHTKPESYEWCFPITPNRLSIKGRDGLYIDCSMSNSIWAGETALFVSLRESLSQYGLVNQ